MAKARRGRKAKSASRKRISFKVTKAMNDAIDAAHKTGVKVQIVGDVKGKQLEFDPKALADLLKQSKPVAFVALNAPFKTKSLTAPL